MKQFQKQKRDDAMMEFNMNNKQPSYKQINAVLAIMRKRLSMMSMKEASDLINELSMTLAHEQKRNEDINKYVEIFNKEPESDAEMYEALKKHEEELKKDKYYDLPF